MNLLLSTLRRSTETKAWTYTFLVLSVALFGAWSWVLYVTLKSPGWTPAAGLPLEYFLTAIGAGFFALLAKLGKPVHNPKANLASILGLIAVIIGALSFGSSSIQINQAFWITVAGISVTLLTLPFGWGSDATVATQASEISRLKADLAVKNELVDALWPQPLKRKATVVLIASATLIGLFQAGARKSRSKKGVRK